MYKLKIVLFLHWFPLVVQLFADGALSVDKPYCEVREPKFTNSYNFTKLSNSAEDILVQRGFSNGTVRVQLCSPLVKKCNGEDNYGVCLTKNNKEIGIGKTPPKVINKSGVISFQFTGDICKPNVNYVVNISMKCDYRVIDNSVPMITSHPDECNLHMVWKTQHACAHRIRTNCTTEYQGLHYDLSSLTRYSDNYIVHTGSRASPSIILNVCHSVIFKNGALCHPNSGVCLQGSANSSNYINLGDVQDSPKFDNGQLIIEYPNGNMCKLPSGPQDIKTTITFACDFESTDSVPKYVGGSEECHYRLTWKTPAACSLESLRNHSASTAGKCTVTNPITNFTYNLQPLMNKDFVATSKSGAQYNFSVCGPYTDNKCKSGTGICLVTNSTSMGMANSKLMWQRDGPFLNYTDGDVCQNGAKRYTVITFQCGTEGSVSEPVVMEEDPCHLAIRWNTYLICEKSVRCATEDGEINLTPLIRWNDNYVVKANNTEFYINVCRPLIPKPGLTCSYGSAACKTLSSSDQHMETVRMPAKCLFPSEHESLGFPEESPRLRKDRIVLRYVDGSSCPEKLDSTISSEFTFVCDYNKEGLPEFKTYANCTYFFEWRTSIACGAVMGDWTPPCTVKDQFLSHQFNLSLLYTKQPTYSVKGKQGEYSIGICGGDKNCNGSAVCQGGNNYGSLTNVILDYSRSVIRLKYSNGSKCVNDSSYYTSEVRLMCNESIGVGEPKLLSEWQCSADFEWQTSVTCIRQSDPNESTNKPGDEDNSHGYSPSHSGTVVAIVFIIILSLGALLYFWNPSRRKQQLRSCLNWITSKSVGGRVKYCRVDTTEEARLLLDASDPTQCQSDSDDDLLGA